jgi:hypothetical protein
MLTGNNFGARKSQVYFSHAIGSVIVEFSKHTRIEPSPESREWSASEGGHHFVDQRAADDVIRKIYSA